MQKFKVVAAACLIACSFFLAIHPAFAATTTATNFDGVWRIVDDEAHGNAFTVNFDSGNTYGLYDGSGNFVYLANPTSTISFDERDNNRVYINNVASTAYFTDTLFYIFEGTWNSDLDLVYDVIGDYDAENWILTFDSGKVLTVLNANPLLLDTQVPIPTAILLLGSGLVGLAGFKRKMDN